MVFEPLTGQRRVKVTERRIPIDFAQVIQELVDEQYPRAAKLGLVLDNLNTHHPASVYEAFAPAEAKLSVLATQCLDRRIPDPTTLQQGVAAWEQRRHQAQCTVDWRFTTQEGRIKLKRLYPSIQLC